MHQANVSVSVSAVTYCLYCYGLTQNADRVYLAGLYLVCQHLKIKNLK